MGTRVASTSITISNIYCEVTPHRTFLLLLDSQQRMLREDSYAELFPLDFQAMNPSLNLFALYATEECSSECGSDSGTSRTPALEGTTQAFKSTAAFAGSITSLAADFACS